MILDVWMEWSMDTIRIATDVVRSDELSKLQDTKHWTMHHKHNISKA